MSCNHLPTIRQAMRQTRELLSSIDGAPTHEAVWLLQYASQLSQAQLIGVKQEQTLDKLAWNTLKMALSERQQGVPLAYIVGSAPFMGELFLVNKHVLVPRPDTEILVRWVIKSCLKIAKVKKNGARINIMELGVGSGAPLTMVGMTLKKSLASIGENAITLMGSDISLEALMVAQRNIETYKVSAALIQSYWLDDMAKKITPNSLHIIYSNPPYIATDDVALTSDGVCAEPTQSLVSGDISIAGKSAKGMADLSHIINHATEWLTSGGILGLEHGKSQGAACRTLMKAAGFWHIETLMDEAGNERVSTGII